MNTFIPDQNYCLIKIPPKIWNGFKELESNPQLLQIVIQSLITQMSLKELIHFTDRVPYDWSRKNE